MLTDRLPNISPGEICLPFGNHIEELVYLLGFFIVDAIFHAVKFILRVHELLEFLPIKHLVLITVHDLKQLQVNVPQLRDLHSPRDPQLLQLTFDQTFPALIEVIPLRRLRGSLPL